MEDDTVRYISVRYVTIGRFSELSGYTERAIRAKIHDGTWSRDDVWIKAPDGRILINIDGYHEWVERGPTVISAHAPLRLR
ncbi:excisionase [Paraburkholderia phenoliruptrix]|uniref:excisionase n=1 Tax=Paraburkholderia phenoliruptrix TaxID=252970 RepID=UPI0034CD5834